VPVGRVTDLLIRIEQVGKSFEVPVQYEIDLTRLTSDAGTFVNLEDPAVLRQQIADGLRAQLQLESLVTGQLYVELSYRSEPDPPELSQTPTLYPEIPTNPSLLAAFGTQAGSVVGDILSILFEVNEMLEAVNMTEINESVVASAQAVERLVSSPEITAALASVPDMSAQFTGTMAEMQRLVESLGEKVEQTDVQAMNDELVLTLQSMRQAMEETRGLISTDSGLGYQLEGAMSGLSDAAAALRALVLSLERNPDMLIRGKQP
jgi:paraquat-inducible protein B